MHEILDSIKRLIEVDGLSQNIIAKQAGISGTSLSLVLLNKYRGNSEAIIEKLSNWLASRDLAREVGGQAGSLPSFIETPAARRILSVFRYVSSLLDVAVIYGGAGVGKTIALRKYAEAQPNCWIVTMSPATASIAASLEEIALALGLRGFSGRASRLQREIIRRVAGTQGVLIIDEAQHLYLGALEAVRAVVDGTGIGLILCGNESVYARLSGGMRTAAFAQLFSRIGKRLYLARSLPGDGAALAKSFGISGEKEAKFIEEIAKNPGSLRGVVKTLRLASVLAHGNGGILNMEHLEDAWADLSGRG